MRAREKVGDVWRVETRSDDGRVEAVSPMTSSAAAHELKRTVRGRLAELDTPWVVVVVHVTRYRLAPLIVLPAWEPQKVACVDGERQAFAFQTGSWADGTRAIVDNIGPGGSVAWDARVSNGNEIVPGDHRSEADAKDACEARLRELGYRVAKAGS